METMVSRFSQNQQLRRKHGHMASRQAAGRRHQQPPGASSRQESQPMRKGPLQDVTEAADVGCGFWARQGRGTEKAGGGGGQGWAQQIEKGSGGGAAWKAPRTKAPTCKARRWGGGGEGGAGGRG